ncbi:MAG: RNA-directed DNA polymerase [Planctomycetaceae bacterium]|nr:RNA-directed DNA polymerase [Planctomycetaceae bacterium]
MTYRAFLRSLAFILDQGFWHEEAALEQVLDVLPTRQRQAKWPRRLIGRIFTTFSRYTRPSFGELSRFLQGDKELKADLRRLTAIPLIVWRPGDQTRPHPVLRVSGDLPILKSVRDFANFLRMPVNSLQALADVNSREARTLDARHRHYNYRWIQKRSGGQRLIEIPKERLKHAQSQLLECILRHVPVHEAARAYRRGLSLRDAVEQHVGQRILLRIDLQDFFPSIGVGKVRQVFRHLGYPSVVAMHMAGLCTNVVPQAVLETTSSNHRLSHVYQLPHLPQGAPTSAVLSNLASYRMDARLTGLAAYWSMQYTRYADDLLFSGDSLSAAQVSRLRTQILAVASDEGFRIRRYKTKVMRAGRQQSALGLTLNSQANTMRRDFDNLRALLNNAVRHGLESQNRDNHPKFLEHLAGRVAYHRSMNPKRGARLDRLLSRLTNE